MKANVDLTTNRAFGPIWAVSSDIMLSAFQVSKFAFALRIHHWTVNCLGFIPKGTTWLNRWHYFNQRVPRVTGYDLTDECLEGDIFDNSCYCPRCGKTKFPWRDYCAKCRQDMSSYDRPKFTTPDRSWPDNRNIMVSDMRVLRMA